MRRIYEEDPSKWPEGLRTDYFHPENLFLVSKQASGEDIGFVGWQEMDMRGKRVGFYSVGILPEHRGKSYAKEAVGQVLREKSAGVDRVVAFVVPGNKASERLAGALGVPIEKLASALEKRAVSPSGVWDVIKTVGRVVGQGHKARAASKAQALSRIGRMWGPAIAMEGLYGANSVEHGGSWGGDGPMTGLAHHPMRLGNFLLNVAMGRMGGHFYDKGRGTLALNTFLGIPVKDVAVNAALAIPKATKSLGRMADAAEEGAGDVAGDVIEKVRQAAGGLNMKDALILAGLGLAGTGGLMWANKKMTGPKTDKGSLKVTLPTEPGSDTETTVELPFDQEMALTKALRSKIERDTRRRLYAETKKRTFSKKNLEEHSKDELVGLEEG